MGLWLDKIYVEKILLNNFQTIYYKLTEMKKSKLNKFNGIQQDMFFPERNGAIEIKTEKKIKAKEYREKQKEKRAKEKHEQKMEELHKFEREHPESFLFKEQRDFHSLLDRMENIGK